MLASHEEGLIGIAFRLRDFLGAVPALPIIRR